MKSPRTSQAGFSLVEVVIAIGVAAFCLIPLSGLLLVGTHANQNSSQQTAAVNIGMAVVADLQATPTTTAKSPYYQITISTAASATPTTLYVDENGQAANPSNTLAATSRYRVSLGFTPPPAAAPRASTLVRVMVTWPAQADPTPALWPTAYTGSWETITSLDRN